MKKQNILIFDSWSVGMNYTSGLAKSLINYNVYYLHLDSLQGQSSKRATEKIKEFKDHKFKDYSKLYSNVYDLKEFGFSVKKALETIKPDLIIFISLHNFEQRYVNEIAFFKNIPCIMFMHGVRGEVENLSLNISGIKDFVNKAKRGKFYFKLYYYYLHDLRYFEKANIKFHLNRFYNLIFKHRLFVESPKKDRGLNYETLFITNKSDVNYYDRNYGLSNINTNFKIIGHIDFHEIIKGLATKKLFPENILLFISNALVRDVGMPEEEFVNAIKISMYLAKELNLNFVLRPHPRDDFELLNKLKDKLGFQISSNDLYTDLAVAKIISGFNSTVLLSAQLLKKPLVIIDSNSTTIHDFYKSYERTVLIKKDDVNKLNIICLKELLLINDMPSVDELIKKDPVHIIKESINDILCLD